ILHPEKYLHDRRDPEKIMLPRRDAKDWRLIGDNVLGEFGLRSLLAQHLGMLEAQRIAAGWNGDRYQAYERGTNGPTALVWTIAWETGQDAGDFESAYRRLADKSGVTAEIRREGNHVRILQSKDAATLDAFK